MSKFVGPHNAPNPGKIAKVGLVFWSKKRAFHGEDVTLSVRTENVPDGTAVELTIVPVGGGEVVDTIKGLSIKTSQLDHKYTIAWKGKPLPKNGRGFVFKAVIGKLKSGESSVLLVDVEPPMFSA
jgi:hypothetical protein